MASFNDISNRKDDHLKICTTQNVETTNKNFWDDVKLPPHRALPEIDLDEVSLKTKFLGIDIEAPLLISSMTGGSQKGEEINLLLSKAAEQEKIPMGVGSQRIAIENRDKKLFNLREKAPSAILYANLGAVQLNYGITNDDCKWLVDTLQANAMILHLNPLQEAIQAEGDRNFKNLLTKIASLKKELKIPLIVKEVGCGLDLQSAQMLIDVGVDALDVSGLGGTHWGYIEGLRNSQRQLLGDIFKDWGIPTPELLRLYREKLPSNYPIIASGGIRNPMDVVKAISLGAAIVGMALPFLKAAEKSFETVIDLIKFHKESLKISLFCMGMKTPEDLRSNEKDQ